MPPHGGNLNITKDEIAIALIYLLMDIEKEKN